MNNAITRMAIAYRTARCDRWWLCELLPVVLISLPQLLFSSGLLARLRHYIHQGRFARLDNLNGALDGGTQLVRIRDWALSMHAHALSELGIVDIRTYDGCSNIGTRNSAVMPVRHALDVHEFLMVAAIVVHDAEKRDLVVRRGPQNPGGVHQVPIALDGNSEAAVFFVGEGRAQRGRGSVADAVAAGTSDGLMVFVEIPETHGPVADPWRCLGGKRPVLVFNLRPELGAQAGNADGAGIPSIRGFCARLIQRLDVGGCETCTTFIENALALRRDKTLDRLD